MIQLDIQDVAKYVLERGIVTSFDRIVKIEQHPADNFVSEVALADGRLLFVKQGLNMTKTYNSVWKEAEFYRLVAHSPSMSQTRMIIPEVVAYDEENNILTTKGFAESEDLLGLTVRTRRAQVPIVRQLAQAVATLHSESAQGVQPASGEPRFDPLFESRRILERFAPEDLADLPLDANRILSSLHRDRVRLVDALDTLRVGRDPRCLIHGDCRLVNTIYSRFPGPGVKPLVLLDWEYQHWGDPTWGLGSVIGDYLNVWIYSMRVHPRAEPSRWFEQAKIPFATTQRATRTFWRTYRSHLRDVEPPEANDVMMFAGLFLIARVAKQIMQNSTILPSSLIAAEVGSRITTRHGPAATRFLGEERLR